jgi:hypothetical protein
MNELAFVAAVAWAIPPVVSFLKNRRWPSEVTMALLGAVSLAVATVGLAVSGELGTVSLSNPEALLGATGLAFMEASVVYRVVTGGVRGERLNEALTGALWDGGATEGASGDPTLIGTAAGDGAPR